MSYDFSANNRYLTGEFSSPYALPITVAMWIKCTASQWAITARDWAMVFGPTVGSSSPSIYMSKTDGAADRVSATSRTASTFDSDAHLDFTPGDYDDVWVCIIGTWTSASRRDMYIESTANTQSSTGTADPGSALDTLTIGGNPFSNNFTGLIGEFAIWDKVLSAGEINSLQTSAETGVIPSSIANGNCIGYWSLDSDQASHADQSGNGGPTLTVTNAVYSSDHPTIASGGTINSKTLTDSAAVTEVDRTTHFRKAPGDNIALITDAQFLYTVFGRFVFDYLPVEDAHQLLGQLQTRLFEAASVQDSILLIRRAFRVVTDRIAGRTNLGLWSHDPSSAWLAGSEGGIMEQNAATAPNGLTEASEFFGDEGGGSSGAVEHREVMPDLIGGQLYRHSMYVENVQGDDWLNIRHTDFVSPTDRGYGWFDLANGVLGTVQQSGVTGIEAASVSIPGAGANWYRIWGHIRPGADSSVTIIHAQRTSDGSGSGARDNNSYHCWGWLWEAVDSTAGTPGALIKTEGFPVSEGGVGISDSISKFQAYGRISTDNALLSDADIQQVIRGKIAAEIISTKDDFQKTISSGGSANIFVRTLDEVVGIFDTQELFKSGVQVEDLFDSISVDEFIAIADLRQRLLSEDIGLLDFSRPSNLRQHIDAENIDDFDDAILAHAHRLITAPDSLTDFSDSNEAVAIRARALANDVAITDDVIVSRSPIFNSVVKSDALAVYDFLLYEFGSTLPPQSNITINIETLNIIVNIETINFIVDESL